MVETLTLEDAKLAAEKKNWKKLIIDEKAKISFHEIKPGRYTFLAFAGNIGYKDQWDPFHNLISVPYQHFTNLYIVEGNTLIPIECPENFIEIKNDYKIMQLNLEKGDQVYFDASVKGKLLDFNYFEGGSFFDISYSAVINYRSILPKSYKGLIKLKICIEELNENNKTLSKKYHFEKYTCEEFRKSYIDLCHLYYHKPAMNGENGIRKTFDSAYYSGKILKNLKFLLVIKNNK